MIDMKDPTTWIAGREMDALVAKAMGWETKWHMGTLCRVTNGIFDVCVQLTTTGDGMLLMLEWGCSQGLVFECMIGRDFSNVKVRDSETFYFLAEGESAKLSEAVARAILAWHAAQQEGETG